MLRKIKEGDREIVEPVLDKEEIAQLLRMIVAQNQSLLEFNMKIFTLLSTFQISQDHTIVSEQ